MKTVVVRYRTRPDAAEVNADLVRDVFAELDREGTEGVRYATFRLEDGRTFVHVAQLEGPGNPLAETAAFKAFQAQIGERCEEGPVAMDAEIVGNHGLLTGA